MRTNFHFSDSFCRRQSRLSCKDDHPTKVDRSSSTLSHERARRQPKWTFLLRYLGRYSELNSQVPLPMTIFGEYLSAIIVHNLGIRRIVCCTFLKSSCFLSITPIKCGLQGVKYIPKGDNPHCLTRVRVRVHQSSCPSSPMRPSRHSTRR